MIIIIGLNSTFKKKKLEKLLLDKILINISVNFLNHNNVVRFWFEINLLIAFIRN